MAWLLHIYGQPPCIPRKMCIRDSSSPVRASPISPHANITSPARARLRLRSAHSTRPHAVTEKCKMCIRDRLLEGVDSEVIDSVRARTDDPTRINARVNNYVEAQIHGGVDLRTDVSEIHIMADMADRAVISRAREFCREHGIRLYLDALDFRQEQHEDAILVRLESMPAPGIPVDPSFDRFKSGELPDILELYRAKEMDFDPTGIHGREHVCRALIFGKALAGIYKCCLLYTSRCV